MEESLLINSSYFYSNKCCINNENVKLKSAVLFYLWYLASNQTSCFSLRASGQPVLKGTRKEKGEMVFWNRNEMKEPNRERHANPFVCTFAPGVFVRIVT